MAEINYKGFAKQPIRRPKITSVSLLSVLEVGFVVLALLLFEPGELVGFFSGGGGPPTGLTANDDLLRQATWLTIYGGVLIFLSLRARHIFYAVTRDKFLLLLLGIVLLSVFWSFAPEFTLRRGFILLATTLFAVYFAIRFRPYEQLQLLAWALGIAAILSLLFALALPVHGIMDSGEWQGIYRHKNAMGRMMALGGMVFLLLAIGSRRYRAIYWTGFVLSASLLLLSNSKGALAIFVTLLILLPLYYALRWSHTLAVPFFIVVTLAGGAAAIWLLGNVEPVLNVLGKDTSLSGRAEIWPAVFHKIQENPWLGYGYSAFWLGWEGESSYVWSVMPGEFFPAHSHNGYLDLWLDLGLLGLMVFAIGFFVALTKATQLARSTEGIATFWPLLYLTYMLLNNITESSILKPNDVWWILYVAAVLSIYIERDRLVNRPSFNPPQRESLSQDA